MPSCNCSKISSNPRCNDSARSAADLDWCAGTMCLRRRWRGSRPVPKPIWFRGRRWSKCWPGPIPLRSHSASRSISMGWQPCAVGLRKPAPRPRTPGAAGLLVRTHPYHGSGRTNIRRTQLAQERRSPRRSTHRRRPWGGRCVARPLVKSSDDITIRAGVRISDGLIGKQCVHESGSYEERICRTSLTDKRRNFRPGRVRSKTATSKPSGCSF